MAHSDYSILSNLFDENIGFRALRLDLFHDLNIGERDKLFKIIRALYFTSPIVKKMVDKPIQLLFENGLQIKFANKQTEKAYYDYLNTLEYSFPFEQLLQEYSRALLLDGELFVPLIWYNTKEVEFSYLVPGLVKKIITKPDNYIIVDRIEYAKQKVKDDQYLMLEETETQQREVARVRKFKNNIDISGDILYFKIGNFPGMRGRSIAEIIMDFAYAYSEMVLDIMRRQKLMSTFVWDVKVEGADKIDLEERKKEFIQNPLPNSGGVRFRNEKEEWNIISPDLNNDDYSSSSKIVLNHMFTGNSTLSKEDFGLDKSSDNELELIIRYINYVINNNIIPMISTIVNCILYNCIQCKTIKGNLDFEIVYERNHTEMIRHLSVSLYQMVSAMKIAREKGWVSDEQVAKIISEITNTEKPNDDIVRLNFGEMNSIANLAARMVDMGFIDMDTAKEFITKMMTSKEFEIIGGSLEYRLGDASGATDDKNNNPAQPTAD